MGEFEPMPREERPIAVSRRKSSRGLLISIIIFALSTVGLGIFVAVTLLNQNNGNDKVSSSKELKEVDYIVHKDAGDTSNSGLKNESKVREIVESLYALTNSTDGTKNVRKVYGDSIYVSVSDDLSLPTDMTYGVFANKTSATAFNIATYKKGVEDVLRDHGLTAHEEKTGAGNYTLYKSSDGIVCMDRFGLGASDLEIEFLCADESWISDDDKNLDMALMSAYKATNPEYNITFIEAHVADIKKNNAGTYETISANTSNDNGYGAAALFYRPVDGEWKFFTFAQQMVYCDEYTTDELKEVYEGESCYDNSSNTERKVTR